MKQVKLEGEVLSLLSMQDEGWLQKKKILIVTHYNLAALL